MGRALRGAAILLGGWLATGCAQIIGADFDVHAQETGCDAGGCVETVADHLAYPWDVAVRDGFVYWTVAGPDTDGGPPAGLVMRASTSGGAAVKLATGQSQPNRLFITADHVYWTSFIPGGGVLRVPREGGSVEGYASEPQGALGICADATHVYWTAESVVKARALADGPGPGTIISKKHASPGILVTDGHYLYFSEFGVGGGVFRLDPAQPMGEVALASNEDQPNGLALTGTGFLLFVTFSEDGAVNKVDLQQGGPSVLKSHQNLPTTVAVGDTFAYWPSFGDGTINKVLWGTSGSVITVASKQRSPNGIAVDGTHVYWTNYDPDGAVMRAPR
jgi:sugar lactone lactonase YvrE